MPRLNGVSTKAQQKMPVNYGSLPFDEAIAFFRNKLNLPTQKWDDLLGAAHDRAFVVAGATQADLLMDLRNAVDSAIANGTTLQQFRKDFNQIVANRGWTGWTGQGTKAGEAWRARVIYDTNLFTSYAAGRYQQMQEVKKTRPYWRWRHSPASVDPRHEHLAWDGKVLSADDSWWSAHYPPSGWGCKCYVETLNARDLAKLGAKMQSGASMPYAGTDPKTGLPNGVDRGWDYAPGASVADELARIAQGKGTALALADPTAALAKSYIAALVNHPLFARFVGSDLGGEFPVAALDAELRQAMAAQQPVVMLSRETVDTHRKHPEIGAADYAKAQRIIDDGDLYEQAPGRVIALYQDGDTLYRAALKRTGDKEKNYWLTLFTTTEGKAVDEVRNKFKQIRGASL